jgi:hypothetical protein
MVRVVAALVMIGLGIGARISPAVAASPPAYVDSVVYNYFSPCPKDTTAKLTTEHTDKPGEIRRAYDWICSAGKTVYAPHGGIVRRMAYIDKTGDHDTLGMVIVEDFENHGCFAMIHLDYDSIFKSKLKEGQSITAGTRIGEWDVNKGHVHIAALTRPSNGCIVYAHSQERPIKFIELGYLPKPHLTQQIVVPSKNPSGSTDIIALHSQKCLQTNGFAGTQVVQMPCDGGLAQTWRFNKTAIANQYNIVHVSSGYCLDVKGAYIGNGGAVIVWSCNGGTNQLFRLLSKSENAYVIMAMHSLRVLDISGASLSDGGQLIQYDSSGQLNQQFRLTLPPQ